MASGQLTEGRRAEEVEKGELLPGDYWKAPDGAWILWVPGTHFLGLFGGSHSGHKIVEHEDSTITVTGSIIIPGEFHLPERWHGYLTHGVWREV